MTVTFGRGEPLGRVRHLLAVASRVRDRRLRPGSARIYQPSPAVEATVARRHAAAHRGSGATAPSTGAERHRSPQRYCGLIPAGTGREVEQLRSGQLRCHPLVRSAATAGLLEMVTPPPPSGSASSMSYRKRRTKTPSPHGSPSDSANDHQITRPAATQAGSTPPHRVRPEPLKRRRITTPAKCFAEPVAEPFC
jgi:hypothetical protein